MPDSDDLNEMADMIAGCKFVELSPDHRAIVMNLAIQADISNSLSHVGAWFDKSKLWEGR